jgi:hypothetical protein
MRERERRKGKGEGKRKEMSRGALTTDLALSLLQLFEVLR